MTENLPDTKVGNIEYIRKQEAIDIVEFECGEWSGLARTIVEAIESIPAADVVPVVRCKDCRYRVDPDKCCHPDGLLRSKDSDFCSHGERRE